MHESLRLLLIEDCEDDALLMIRELQHNGFDIFWQRVQTARSLQKSLESDTWDVIISDNHLPGFSAASALEILKSSQLDIPFIVVSGAICDEFAVQLMKAGAVDYLMKDNLARLPETIRREVRDCEIRAQHQQAILDLHNTQERLQLAIEGSGIGLWDWWIETGTITLNNRWAEMIGYSLFELEPINLEVLQRYIHSQDWQRSMMLLEDHFQQRSPIYECELRMRHKEGHWIWVLSRGRVVERDRTGRPRRIAGTHLDITDRKEQEVLLAARERYLTSLVSIQNQLFSTQIDHRICQNILEILGTTVEAERISLFENCNDESGNLFMIQLGDWCAAGVSSHIIQPEPQDIPLDGRATRWFAVLSHGEIINSAVVDLPPDEREILEAQGILSILILPLIVNEQFWGMIRLDNYLETRQWEPIEIEFLRSAVTTLSLAKEREHATQLIARLNQNLERRVERRTASLQESEAKLQAIIDFAPAMISVKDLDGNYTSVNRSYSKFFGYSKEDLLGKKNSDLFPADIAEKITQNERIVLEGGQLQQYEEEITFNDCQYTFISNKFLLFNRNWQPYALCGISVDITERKQTEKAMQRQIAAIEAAADGIALLEGDTYIYLNQAHVKLFGFDHPDELLGVCWHQFYTPTELQRFEQEVFPSLRQNGSWQGEVTALRKDGSAFLEGLSLTILDDGLLICVCRDISSQKQAEQNLKSLSNRLALALQSAEIGTWDWDLINEVQWDDRMYEIYGLQDLDRPVTYQDWLNILYPEDQLCVVEFVESVKQGLGDRSAEFRIIRPDGSIRVVQAFATLEYDANNQPYRMVGINYDITARKQAEYENQSLKERLEFVLSSSPAIIYTCQPYGYYDHTFISQNIQHILGYSPSDCIQQDGCWMQHIHPEDLPNVLVSFQDICSQKLHVNEYRFLKKDGTYCWIYDQCRVVFDAHGNPIELVGYIADISEQKATEEVLRKTNAELERATRLKDEFLASMSHELRTPLNAILGMSEGLQDEIFGRVNEDQKKAISTIERSGRHLLELINDILDLSKIEANKFELDIEPVSVRSLCDGSFSFVKQLAFQKKITLVDGIGNNLNEVNIQVDVRRMRQVLINLLSNAVKFTPEGGRVSLRVSLEESSKQPLICFSVVDTGIGISEENLCRLFQSFVQIDSRLNRQYAGTGLGLALVKRITELHGGTVSVTSRLGEGSCFEVRIPCITSPDSQLPEVSRKKTASNTVALSADRREQSMLEQPLILLAEDNVANTMTIASYLKAQNYRLISAQTGYEAIALAESQEPALILMDIQMPEMDGLEAIARIRSSEKLKSIPIIALTALTTEFDRERCLRAGANGYLNKPVKLKQLVATVQKLLNNGR